MAKLNDITPAEWAQQRLLADKAVDMAIAEEDLGFPELTVNAVNALTANNKAPQMTCMAFAAAVLRLREHGKYRGN